MARDMTTAFQSAVIAGTVRPIYLVEMFFDSETLRFWNGIGELTYDSDTYIGSGTLLKIGQIGETKSVQALGTVFRLSGVPSSLILTALSEDYQDRKITIHFGAFDAAGDIISDPITTFSGKANVMTIEEGGQRATIEMTAESDLVTLRRVKERRLTSEDQQAKYPGDLGFQKVPALQDTEIVWQTAD